MRRVSSAAWGYLAGFTAASEARHADSLARPDVLHPGRAGTLLNADCRFRVRPLVLSWQCPTYMQACSRLQCAATCTGCPCTPAQVLERVDVGKAPPHGHPQPQVALAKAEGVVQDDQVRVAVRQLAEHVVAHDAEVDIPVCKLPDHVRGPLEPDLQIWQLHRGGQSGEMEGVCMVLGVDVARWL